MGLRYTRTPSGFVSPPSVKSVYIIHLRFHIYTIMWYLQVTDILVSVFIANLNIPTTRFHRFIKAVVSTSLKPSSSPCRSLRRSLTACVSCFSRTCSTAFDVFKICSTSSRFNSVSIHFLKQFTGPYPSQPTNQVEINTQLQTTGSPCEYDNNGSCPNSPTVGTY